MMVSIHSGAYPGEKAAGRAAGLVGALLLVTGLVPQAALAAWQCSASSPAHRMAVVELYTSEGCSSCPPADQWLAALTESTLSVDQVLPLALHVDYWDYIGWKDPYASTRYTDRQRQHADQNRSRGLYTPQVLTDGRDTRDWHNASSFLARVAKINASASPLTLNLTATTDGAGQPGLLNVTASVTVDDATAVPAGRNVVHIVLFENALRSQVSRGENAGRTLEHDRVVRHWAPPESLQGSTSLQRQIRLPAGARADRSGLAMLVESERGEIVQAAHCTLMPAT